MTIAKEILNFIETNSSRGTVTVPDEVMGEYLESCKSALNEMFSSYASKFPTVSDLGKDELYLWCRRNLGPVEERVSPQLSITFWRGKVVEALLIAILRMAGIKLISVQKRVFLHDEHIPDAIRGRMDVVVEYEGKQFIVDIKIAHAESYKEKFASHEALTEKDWYGYNAQAGAYEVGEGLPFAGWLVFNSDSSDLKFVPVSDQNIHISKLSEALGRVEKAYGERPALPTEPEYYKGEPTGNIRVPPSVARSPYVRQLYPNATYAKRGEQTLVYTEFNGFVIPGVKLEKKDA